VNGIDFRAKSDKTDGIKYMKKTNQYSIQNIRYVDYKDIELMKMFLTPHGQMQGKRRTVLTAKQQRAFSTAVKRARYMGLLPYVAS